MTKKEGKAPTPVRLTKARKQPEIKTVAAVERALDILDAFRPNERSLSLVAMVERTGLYKSTILRLADTLEQRGYLIRLPNGAYQVGPKPFSLGALFQASTQPEAIVIPALERLVEQTRESASFSIRQGDLRVRLYRVQSPQPIRDQIHAGDIGPLDHGAAGRMLLAFAEPLDPQYAQIRKDLIAHVSGEMEEHGTGIAAPVFDATGAIMGALVLSGPSFRFTDDVTARYEQLLLETGLELTEKMGGDASPFAARGIKRPR